MVEVQETSAEQAAQPISIWYWITLGVAALGAFGWLTWGLRTFLQWRGVLARSRALQDAGSAELANQGFAFAGGVAVEMGYAIATALLLAFVAGAVGRRTWNAWDYATVVIGFATAFSLIMLCARGRSMFFIPFTTAPVLALLYAPGTKKACGVGQRVDRSDPPAVPDHALNRAELEGEIAKERSLIMQLRQNLDVFEVERGMDTDRFVARYAEGIEEDTADNADWFAIARAVRRSRERLTSLQDRLAAMDNGSRG